MLGGWPRSVFNINVLIHPAMPPGIAILVLHHESATYAEDVQHCLGLITLPCTQHKQLHTGHDSTNLRQALSSREGWTQAGRCDFQTKLQRSNEEVNLVPTLRQEPLAEADAERAAC